MSISILTPDQRVRVFISSTIGELAHERKATKEAIERLHLIPVFFEMGARPHPPRDLYRAYLEQSHVFIGIYYKSYGWVAPGMEISGLEDEYQLSSAKPRLIYVRKSEEARDPKLQALLEAIENGATVCYQKFSTGEELKDLIANDLSLLLSEHFQKNDNEETRDSGQRTPLPQNQSKLIGREKDLKAIHALLEDKCTVLVTITGTGGTGKSRISLHIANEIKNRYRDGVYFMSLAGVPDADSFIPAFAENLGLYDSGKQSLKETILHFLFDKHALILLDNFEHIISAAAFLPEIMQHCKDLTFLVTSRSPLHLRDEHVYPLAPLETPVLTEFDPLSNLEDFPAIELFIQRAQEINPALVLDNANLKAISAICTKLDGIPLAIELAAARTKLLSPVALLNRMESVLDTLTKGARDLPERHKTLRATIDWSYQLLDENCKNVFRRLSVFRNGWTLDSADAVANIENSDILDIMEKLQDFALIQSRAREYDTYFIMFETVREYAQELLASSGEAPVIKSKQKEYLIAFLEEAKQYAWTPQRDVWLKKIDTEYPNIRDIFYDAIRVRDFNSTWRIVQTLGFYWTVYGKITEALRWIGEAHVTASPGDSNIRNNIDKKTQAGALRSVGIIQFFGSFFPASVDSLKESVRLYLEEGAEMEAGRSLSYLGIAGISAGDYQSATNFQQALLISNKHQDFHGYVIAATFLSEVLAATGKIDEAKALAAEAIKSAKEQDDHMLCALSLGQRGNIEIITSDYSKAATYYRESLSYEKKSRLGSMTGWFQIGLGLCLMMEGDYEESRKFLTNGLSSGRATGDKAIILSAFIAFAGYALKRGNLSKGARLYGAAENLMKLSGYTLWNETKRVNEWVIHELASANDHAFIESEKMTGNQFSLDEGIEMALNVN